MADIQEISAQTSAEAFMSLGIKAEIIRLMHGDSPLHGDGILKAARKSPEARALLVAMANAGYYLYRVTDAFSALVQHNAISALRKRLQAADNIQFDANGLMYSLENPLNEQSTRSLLVIFSTIKTANNLFSRHFLQNFSTINKYIPDGTAVLRIADLGSVKGAFYLNTNYLHNNEQHIQELIQRTARQLKTENVVLYGTSKGGTAALYHAITGGYKAVAVDPVVSDDYYVRPPMNDRHFTVGTFPSTKQDRFRQLFFTNNGRLHPEVSVVYSSNSEQFSYIDSLLVQQNPGIVSLYNSSNSAITTHDEVAKATLPLTVSLLSLYLYGLPVKQGHFSVT